MRTTTTNGAGAYTTTSNPLLDLFGSIGASRNNPDGIRETFDKAFEEDSLKATAILAYARDIRNNGAGERQVFKTLVKELVDKDIKLASRICELTPTLGRWDDLKAFYGTSLEKKAATIWADAILRDEFLACKWANRSDKCLQKALNYNECKLRKHLARVRKDVIPEAKMCSNKWNEIEYGSLPSKCGMLNANVFKHHNGERYNEFINSKNTKVNASVAFPYDVYRLYSKGENRASASKYWANLPTIDINGNILMVVDTSGSMMCKASGEITCLDIAVSLGAYLSQQINGKFKNKLITFSSNPTLVTIPETNNISEIFLNVVGSNPTFIYSARTWYYRKAAVTRVRNWV